MTETIEVLVNSERMLAFRIGDYPDYYVEPVYGLIWSAKSNMFRKNMFDRQTGYYNVMLYRDGKANANKIHKLVARTMFGDDDRTVDHINADRQDNCYLNLRYATSKEQSAYQSAESKRRDLTPVPVISIDEHSDRLRFNSQQEAERILGLCRGVVGLCLMGRQDFTSSKRTGHTYEFIRAPP